jgi:hypothetical protein
MTHKTTLTGSCLQDIVLTHGNNVIGFTFNAQATADIVTAVLTKHTRPEQVRVHHHTITLYSVN